MDKLKRLLLLIPGMDESTLLAQIYLLKDERDALLTIYDAFAVKECDCPIKLSPCNCSEARRILEADDTAIDKIEAIRELNQRAENPAVAEVLPPPLWFLSEKKAAKIVRRLLRVVSRRSCDCPMGARLVWCRHIREAKATPLTDDAQALLCRLLWPDEYLDPEPPETPSPVLLPRSKVQDFIDRAHATPPRGLWHDDDAISRKRIDPGEALQADREVWGQRNGAPAFGQFRRRKGA